MPQPDRDLDFRTDDAFAEAEDSRRRDDQVQQADAGPVDDAEAASAAEGLTTTPAEDKAYREHVERGANVQGEGAPTF
jgi:hypothetical protein